MYGGAHEDRPNRGAKIPLPEQAPAHLGPGWGIARLGPSYGRIPPLSPAGEKISISASLNSPYMNKDPTNSFHRKARRHNPRTFEFFGWSFVLNKVHDAAASADTSPFGPAELGGFSRVPADGFLLQFLN